jgi:hypothetical protein
MKKRRWMKMIKMDVTLPPVFKKKDLNCHLPGI